MKKQLGICGKDSNTTKNSLTGMEKRLSPSPEVFCWGQPPPSLLLLFKTPMKEGL